jgi:Zn-dependent peptidase ImmA (M78 family)
MSAATKATTLVVDGRAILSSQRFTAARALGRRTFDTRTGEILLTNTRRQYGEKIERAFAAEFLAPADGVSRLLDDDSSDQALERAAHHYQVSTRVIEHQVENQLAV